MPKKNRVTPLPESTVKRMQIPDVPLVKMAKAEHVDAFFEEGVLQLGSFQYFNQYDHEEIGDAEEGVVVLLAERDGFTAAGRYGGGYDNYIFCTYAGFPDKKVLAGFGYDDGFFIRDPEKFSEAIQRAIHSQDFEYAACIYSPHKALIGRVQSSFKVERIDSRTIEMVSTARHFIKPDRYADQKEFRFTWHMSQVVDAPKRVLCPEAAKYCERL